MQCQYELGAPAALPERPAAGPIGQGSLVGERKTAETNALEVVELIIGGELHRQGNGYRVLSGP